MQVLFKFSIGDKVKTRYNQEGFIIGAFVDQFNSKHYSIEFENGEMITQPEFSLELVEV